MTNQIENHFSYYDCVEYDYDGNTCTNPNCGCRNGDYCRCRTYKGLRVTKIDLEEVRKHFLPKNNKGGRSFEFVEYCVDRILRLEKVYDTDNWTMLARNGYYGEELSHAELATDLFTTIVEKVHKILSLPPSDRIRYVLEEEYQSLLPELVNCKFKEIEVNISDIFIPNKEYHKKIKDLDSVYNEFMLPIGIYKQEGNKYRLIDGYHRYCSFVSMGCHPTEVSIITAV